MTVQLTMLAYFCALMFWLEMSLGLMGILMIGRLTGGRWFEYAEPAMLRSTTSLILMAILFTPILFMLNRIYPWAAAIQLVDETSLRTTFFLNPFWFRIRSIAYWILWLGLAQLLRSNQGKRRLCNGLGLLIMLVTCSFSAMDWIMTLDSEWSSTGFGVAFISSELISGFCFITGVVVFRKGQDAPLRDYGNLLLMAILFWIYANFLEFLIIWSGQIPREMHWYRIRSVAPYDYILESVIAFGFFVPFFALLFRKFKSKPVLLIAIAILLWLMRWLEIIWLILPENNLSAIYTGGIALLFSIFIGFLWFGLFLKLMPLPFLSCFRKDLAHEI